MTAAVSHIEEGLGIGRIRASLVLVAGFLAVITALVVAGRTNAWIPALLAGPAVIFVLLSFRWPMLPLFAFVMLVPIEEAVVIEGFGTLSRYMEILFIVAYGLPRLGRLTLSAVPLAAWGYLAWAALSLSWAVDPAATLLDLPVLALLFTMAALVASVVTERPSIVRPLLTAYTISAAVTAVIGLVEFVQGTLVAEDRVAAIQGQDPAHYAALLLPALVFSAYELVHGRQIFLFAPIAFLCTAGIIVSGTRGAWVAAIVVAAFYVFPRLDLLRRIVAIAIISGLLALTVQLPGVGALIADRTSTAISSGGAGRTDIWTVGLVIYESAPVTGVGFADFSAAYTPERIRETDVEIIAPWRPAFRDPHNLIIGTLGELGTVGLIVLAAFLLPHLLRRGWGPDAAVVQAAFAAMIVMAMFLDLLNRKEIWLLIGISWGLAWLARRPVETGLGLEPASVPVSLSPATGT